MKRVLTIAALVALAAAGVAQAATPTHPTITCQTYAVGKKSAHALVLADGKLHTVRVGSYLPGRIHVVSISNGAVYGWAPDPRIGLRWVALRRTPTPADVRRCSAALAR